MKELQEDGDGASEEPDEDECGEIIQAENCSSQGTVPSVKDRR